MKSWSVVCRLAQRLPVHRLRGAFVGLVALVADIHPLQSQGLWVIHNPSMAGYTSRRDFFARSPMYRPVSLFVVRSNATIAKGVSYVQSWTVGADGRN